MWWGSGVSIFPAVLHSVRDSNVTISVLWIGDTVWWGGVVAIFPAVLHSVRDCNVTYLYTVNRECCVVGWCSRHLPCHFMSVIDSKSNVTYLYTVNMGRCVVGWCSHHLCCWLFCVLSEILMSLIYIYTVNRGHCVVGWSCLTAVWRKPLCATSLRSLMSVSVRSVLFLVDCATQGHSAFILLLWLGLYVCSCVSETFLAHFPHRFWHL